jgi:hypothetical protein
MKNFNQLCIWPGTILETEEGKISFEDFETWVANNFNGVRIKMMEEVKTLPDMEDGVPVPDTGGRNDLFFYVHDEDIPKFAVARLQAGIRWWEDVLGNGNGDIYPEEILEKYPKTW